MIKRAKKSVSLCLLALALTLGLAQPLAAADVPPPRNTSPAAGSNTTATTTKKGFVPSEKYKHSKIKKNVAKAQETNKEVKGWLTVTGTNINEPVTFYAKDNYRYLYRTWQGKNYPNTNYKNFVDTAIYADYRVKWGKDSWQGGSRNTVLYGHNWTNLRAPIDIGADNKHTMFGQLPSYTDINFAKENPYIYFSTGDYEGVWKVFSVAYCELDVKNFPYNTPNLTKADYAKILAEWKERTLFDFDVEVDSSDRILTLSTCTRYYKDIGDRQRYVVVARLLRDGESDTDKVKVTVNKDQKKPQFKKTNTTKTESSSSASTSESASQPESTSNS